ncbi:MAG: hypothetical protein K2X77_01715 [Candidatus Obscuribacterales bacterium]|jgi:hypothetical protein|nr:hypothetical protein [Candidatus Obscuribacterales bacterium]
MEYAASLQQIGNAELALGFEIAKAPEVSALSEEELRDRTIENLLMSTVMSVPAFQAGAYLGQGIVAQIGQLTCVHEAAAFLLTFYALTTIPAMFYAAQKKGITTNLCFSATFASILGCLSYLSLS